QAALVPNPHPQHHRKTPEGPLHGKHARPVHPPRLLARRILGFLPHHQHRHQRRRLNLGDEFCAGLTSTHRRPVGCRNPQGRPPIQRPLQHSRRPPQPPHRTRPGRLPQNRQHLRHRVQHPAGTRRPRGRRFSGGTSRRTRQTPPLLLHQRGSLRRRPHPPPSLPPPLIPPQPTPPLSCLPH